MSDLAQTLGAALAALVIGLLMVALGWLIVQWSLTPYQRFLEECSETHEVLDCHQAWHRAQSPIVVPHRDCGGGNGR